MLWAGMDGSKGGMGLSDTPLCGKHSNAALAPPYGQASFLVTAGHSLVPFRCPQNSHSETADRLG